MIKDPTVKLAAIVHLFSDIQRYVQSLSSDKSETIYLFFVSSMSVSEISYVCEFTPTKIRLIITNFVADILTKCKKLRTFLIHLSLLDKPAYNFRTFSEKWRVADLTGKTCLLTLNCKKEDFIGTRIRELIRTALYVGTPLSPVKYHTDRSTKSFSIDTVSEKQNVAKCVTYESTVEESLSQKYFDNSTYCQNEVETKPNSKILSSLGNDTICHTSSCRMLSSLKTDHTSCPGAILHRAGKCRISSISGDRVRNLKPHDFDFFLNMLSEKMTIRTRSGKDIEYSGDFPHLGNKTLSLLFTLLSQPGMFLSADEISENDSNVSVRSVHHSLEVRLAMLRKSFGENNQEPWFFLTKKPYAITFNKERSYCLVSSTGECSMETCGN